MGANFLFNLFFFVPLLTKTSSGFETPITNRASRAATCSACFLEVYGALVDTITSPKQTVLINPVPWKRM